MELNNKTKNLTNEKDTNNIPYLNTKFGSRMTVVEVDTGDIPAQFDDVNDLLIQDVAITNNGYSVVANQYYVSYYDNTGKFIRRLGNWGAKTVAINPVDNNILAIGTEFGKIEMWNLDTGNLIGTIGDGKLGEIITLEFSRVGSRLMSVHIRTEDKLKVWNPTTGERIGFPLDSEVSVPPQISFNGDKIAYTIYDYSTSTSHIKVVEVETGQSVIPDIKVPNPSSPLAISFEPNDKEILVAVEAQAWVGCSPVGKNQTDILRYSLSNGQRLGRTFEGQVNIGYEFGLSASNITNDLLISTDNKSSAIVIWDRTTARIKQCIKLASDTVAHFTRISPDGKYFLIVTQTNNLETDYSTISKHQKLSELKNTNCIHNKDITRTKSSNLADVTNEILKSSTETAPVCAGISEFNILDGIGIGLRNKYVIKYPIPNHSSLFLAVYPSHNSPITISLDNDRKKIQIHVPLFIDVNHLDDRVITHRVSRTRVSFTLQAEPNMVTQANSAQSLQLDFEGSKQDTDIDTFIIDPNTVLGTMGSDQALIILIEETVNNLLNASGEGISMYLSSLVAHAKMPSAWNRAREYVLIFKEFIFQNVTVQSDSETRDVEYIFILCTVVSLNYPPPCICKEDTENLTPSTRKEINDPRRWLSLAFSQDALNVLIVPRRNSGGRVHREKGGTLRRSADSYHKSEIGTMYINDNDNVIAEVSVGGGGSVSARLIDPIFHSTLMSFTAGHDWSARNVKVRWDISILPNFNGENVTSVVLTPTVFLNAENIHFKFDTSFPGPMNDVLSWFVEVFLKILATIISTTIMQLGNIELIYDLFKNNQDDFNILNAWGTSYKRSSIVVIAEVTTCKLGDIKMF
ncbi:hypothetical protein AB1K32_19510 [Metabacillus dongyingensis]|uniref:WD40 repeat domain-containing protein n=1 Tax=Metabacillus dongyingensis TaxID=2874282 RepID=UPI003B8D1CB0